MEVYLAGKISFDSIVDGPGLRAVVWFQGCIHNCPGCQNPNTHDFNKGINYDTNDIVDEIMKDSLQSGVTFSGGDPLSQCEAALDIAKKLKEKNINIWCYTGFEYETLIKNKSSKEFLEYIDVLVDGPYIEKLKSYDLKFKGSSNQRVINVQESLKQNKIVLWNEA